MLLLTRLLQIQTPTLVLLRLLLLNPSLRQIVNVRPFLVSVACAAVAQPPSLQLLALPLLLRQVFPLQYRPSPDPGPLARR